MSFERFSEAMEGLQVKDTSIATFFHKTDKHSLEISGDGCILDYGIYPIDGVIYNKKQGWFRFMQDKHTILQIDEHDYSDVKDMLHIIEI